MNINQNYQVDLRLIPKNLYINSEINSNNETVLISTKENLISLLKFLRDDQNLRFKILADICGIDYLSEYNKRFCVVYNLLSMKFNKRIFIKIFTDEFEQEPSNYEMNYKEGELKNEKGIFQGECDKTKIIECEERICEINQTNSNENYKTEEGIPSVFNLFSSAFWLEREVYDMFGIIFSNMKDPRRLLNDYGFKGFPLRKDFPLSGYKEVYYDISEQKVLYRDLNLDQEYRNFDFQSSWRGPEIERAFSDNQKDHS